MTRTCFLLTAFVLTAQAAIAEPSPELNVRILNDAEVSGMMLKEAISTATKVYKKAGVRVSWLDCTPGQKRLAEACRETASPGTRLLRLVPAATVGKLRPAAGELGRAALRQDRSGGRMAYVFASLVENLAGRAANGLEARLLYGRLLGCAMAHELAHLLGVHHSDAGVMGVGWGLDELEDVRGGRLGFEAGEAGRIAAAVRRPATALGD